MGKRFVSHIKIPHSSDSFLDYIAGDTGAAGPNNGQDHTWSGQLCTVLAFCLNFNIMSGQDPIETGVTLVLPQ